MPLSSTFPTRQSLPHSCPTLSLSIPTLPFDPICVSVSLAVLPVSGPRFRCHFLLLFRGPGTVGTLPFNRPSLPLLIGFHLLVRSPPLPSHSLSTPLLPHQPGSWLHATAFRWTWETLQSWEHSCSVAHPYSRSTSTPSLICSLICPHPRPPVYTYADYRPPASFTIALVT